MKKQFLSLIVALFVTATFTFANNGQPEIETLPSTDVSEFVAPAKLGMIIIQGQTISTTNNNISCKIVDTSNQTCVRILQKSELESILYVYGPDGNVSEKVQAKSFNMTQVMKGNEILSVVQYVPFSISVSSSSSLQVLSVQ